MKDHSDKEAYKMGKDRTTEDMIRILQEEVEIPQIVQKKTDAAFRQIRIEAAVGRKTEQKVAGQSKAEDDDTYRSEKRRDTDMRRDKKEDTEQRRTGRRTQKNPHHIWQIGAAAACLTVVLGVGVAAYSSWSRNMEKGMQATPQQLEQLESEQHRNITVRQTDSP